jgi:hypothetical protein
VDERGRGGVAIMRSVRAYRISAPIYGEGGVGDVCYDVRVAGTFNWSTIAGVA